MRVSTKLLSLLLLVAGCASSTSAGESETDAPVLEGVYYASSGPNAWASFKNDTYVTWSSAARCADYDKAPADCAEHGTFAADADEVVFTSDAGAVTRRKLAAPESIGTRSIVGDGQQLVDGSNASSKVSLVEPGQQQLAANTFQKIGIVCRVVSLIINPLNQPVIVPPIAPAPIAQQQCAAQG